MGCDGSAMPLKRLVKVWTVSTVICWCDFHPQCRREIPSMTESASNGMSQKIPLESQ